jgi:hypothetical protein
VARALLFHRATGELGERKLNRRRGDGEMTVQSNVDLIDVYDQLLSLTEQSGGKPHGLFISSSTDLECCIVMLSGEADLYEEDFERTETRQYPSYHLHTNN